MQVYTSNGRIIMKDGKIGIGPDCCDLTCDGYGSSGGGAGCNDDIMGICCVPGTGGTCGEATQCDCDAAGGTWRFSEVDGQEVIPPGGIFNKCGPSGVSHFIHGPSGAAYTVCSCEAGANLTVVWRDLQPHPDYSRTQGDVEDIPLTACNKCKSFVSIGDVEEFMMDRPYAHDHPGIIFCGEEDCYTEQADPSDPSWIWNDSSLVTGDSDIYSRNCTKIPNYRIPPCLDLDGDDYEDGGTGSNVLVNPCLDPGNLNYPYCTCYTPFYVGFQSGVWSNSNSWDPCVEYGYDGLTPCSGPECP